MAQHYVYEFYAELKDYEPKIWRRFKIAGSKTVAELGYTLMVLFEMQASHLFCFTEDRQTAFMEHLKKTYSGEDIDNFFKKRELDDLGSNAKYELNCGQERWTAPNEKLYDADKYKLTHLSRSEGWELGFNYDYGDDWNVAVVLEKCEKKEISLAELPCVTDGAGYGIIEDIGGVGGLEGFAMAMKKGSGEEYEEYCEWLGVDSFDMTKFDMDDLNFRLKKLIRVYRDIYEYGDEPTQKSIDIIERKYLL